MPTPQSCRVFLSYSHDSPEHQERVLAFASRLVTEGIDVTLDQWVINPDGGWPLWTESQISKADFVLLVCTDTYRKRVEHPDETQGGAGAFWEANLIRRRLYDGKGVNDHFVPVFFGASGSSAIPEMLEGFSYYQIDSPAGYIALYRRLTNQPEVERPELGKLVVLPRRILWKRLRKRRHVRRRTSPVSPRPSRLRSWQLCRRAMRSSCDRSMDR